MVNVICACGVLTPKGTLCPCKARSAKSYEQQRGSASARGYDQRWRIESKAWLAALGAPLCACGCGRKANVVDHRVAHKGNQALFWDKTNWQPMAFSCNSRKAAKHEGGFGRPKQ